MRTYLFCGSTTDANRAELSYQNHHQRFLKVRISGDFSLGMLH